MKKFLCGFLAGAIIFSMVGAFAVSYVANPVDFKVLVNGKEFVSDPPALEVNGSTYLPLRAMGDALGVPVNWNEKLRQAEVGNRSYYEKESNPETENYNENKSGYITYKEKPWCPDFGVWVGKTPKLYVPNEKEGSLYCVYKASGVTMEDIKGYMKLFHDMGYEVGTVSGGYACKDASGEIRMGIVVKGNEIQVVVW